MKTRFLILFLFSSLLTPLRAQSSLDTLFGSFLTFDTLTYQSPNGGYVSGNNGYGDDEKMQIYFSKINKALIGVLVWYSRAELNSDDSESKIAIRIRKVDSTQVSTNSWIIKGPDTLLYEKYHSLSTITTGPFLKQSLTYYPLDYYIFPSKVFSVGIGLDSLSAGDTLACQTTRDTLVLPFRRSWENWNGTLTPIFDSWGLNIDLALFPVFDTSLVFNVQQNIFSNQWEVFPNPAKEIITIKHDKNEAPEWVSLMDLKGNLVSHQVLNKGKGSSIVDLNDISSGAYLMVAGDKNKILFTSKIIVVP